MNRILLNIGKQILCATGPTSDVPTPGCDPTEYLTNLYTSTCIVTVVRLPHDSVWVSQMSIGPEVGPAQLNTGYYPKCGLIKQWDLACIYCHERASCPARPTEPEDEGKMPLILDLPRRSPEQPIH